MTYYHITPLGQFLILTSLLKENLSAKPFGLNHALGVKRVMQQAQDLVDLVYYVPQLSFCIDWESKMAKMKPDFNLIDYRLSDLELEQYEAWLEKHAPNPTNILTELAGKDYKTSFTFVENSEAWCVSVTGKEGAKFNEKSTLTTWSDEPMDALYMAAFKIFEVFSGGVWKTKNQSKRG